MFLFSSLLSNALNIASRLIERIKSLISSSVAVTISSFNMVFTSLTIKKEAEDVGSATNIKLSQIAAVKGSTMTKLASYWSTGLFEKSMKTNLRKLKSGVGGFESVVHLASQLT